MNMWLPETSLSIFSVMILSLIREMGENYTTAFLGQLFLLNARPFCSGASYRIWLCYIFQVKTREQNDPHWGKTEAKTEMRRMVRPGPLSESIRNRDGQTKQLPKLKGKCPFTPSSAYFPQIFYTIHTHKKKACLRDEAVWMDTVKKDHLDWRTEKDREFTHRDRNISQIQ